jgi:hypothetical protein
MVEEADGRAIMTVSNEYDFIGIGGSLAGASLLLRW